MWKGRQWFFLNNYSSFKLEGLANFNQFNLALHPELVQTPSSNVLFFQPLQWYGIHACILPAMLSNFNPENGNAWRLMWFYRVLKSVENSFFSFLANWSFMTSQKDSNPRSCDAMFIFKWLPIFLVIACCLHLQDPNSLTGPPALWKIQLDNLPCRWSHHHHKNVGNGLPIDTASYSKTT